MVRRVVTGCAVLIVVGASALPAWGAFIVRGTDAQRFRPRVAEVADGTRVVWRAGTLTHTVTSYGGGWSKNSTFGPGDPTGFRFTDPGTYRYRCRFHSTLSAGTCTGMCGVVVVG